MNLLFGSIFYIQNQPMKPSARSLRVKLSSNLNVELQLLEFCLRYFDECETYKLRKRESFFFIWQHLFEIAITAERRNFKQYLLP